MPEKENPHKDHRARIRKRFINNGNAFEDHELLEFLLFYSVPRKNTNNIAHDLLRKFDSLSGVVHAPMEALAAVEGVGENSACLLNLIGKISDRIIEDPEKDIRINSPKEARMYLESFLNNEPRELFYVFYTNQSGNVIRKDVFSQNLTDKVTFDYAEIERACLLIHPKAIILAHNHPAGTLEPSEADDRTTGRLMFFCKLFKINLYDHLIFSKNSVYSYRDANRLLSTLNKYKNLALEDIKSY